MRPSPLRGKRNEGRVNEERDETRDNLEKARRWVCSSVTLVTKEKKIYG